MRIAYLNPQPVPDTLPSTLQVLQFADALAAIGNAVEVVTPAPPQGADAASLLGRPPAAGLTFAHQADRRRRWYFPFSSNRLFHAEALAWLRANPVDLVYVRNLKLAEALIKSGLDVPLVFETHELFAQSFREHHAPLGWRARAKLASLEARESFVYRGVAGLIPITHALLEDIRTGYGVATPALVAPDGVDLELAEDARTAAAESSAEPVLLYLGSLHRWKGVETLLEAMPLVPRGELWIAGGTPARIAELGGHPAVAASAGRIRFLGAVPPAERFRLIARADVCLLPLANTSIGSRYTSPLKLFEYMAMGKAIVASDHASIREVLAEGDSGRLVPAEQPAALAEAINRLVADPHERGRLGARARELAVRYSWRARAEAVSAWAAQTVGRP